MSDDAVVSAVAAALPAWPRTFITVAEVEDLVVAARPELNASNELRDRLVEVVDRLLGLGVVTATKRTTVHRGVRLPTRLNLVGRAVRSAPPRPARRHPWHPDLAWAAHLVGPVVEDLLLLDRWLTDHADAPPAPVKERSIEVFGHEKRVFGHEKRLEQLFAGSLRGRHVPGLRTFVVHPPLVCEDVADARGGLVVENATTFHSLVTAAREHVAAGAPTTIGWIAYGAGNQVGAATPGLVERGPTALWYFGDLDGRGLRFAAASARAADAAGLPPVRPHRELYEALLALGRPQPRRRPWDWEPDGLAWLGLDLGARVQGELVGTWLAQEWVGLQYLRRSTSWLSGAAPEVATIPTDSKGAGNA